MNDYAADRLANWTASDLDDTAQWIHRLSDAETADLDRALRTTKARHGSCATMVKEDFPLDAMRPTLARLLDRLENGRGVYVLRGIPTERYSKEDLRLMYWGIGLNMGRAVSQSRRGDLLGDVKNFNSDFNSAKGRGYVSRQHLGFHTDTSDVVGLFVIQTAMRGGVSMFCSSLAVHDEIKRTRPDLLEVLYQPFHWSWKGQEEPGELPYYTMPVYSSAGGRFSSRFIRSHIRAAQEFPDVPRLTAKQEEAINLVFDMANDRRFCREMKFESGDVQFLNNHVTMHARTEFEDFPEPERKRHLLRLWLAVPNSRPLDDGMKAIFRDTRAGAFRGGFPSRVSEHTYETVNPD
ncbi:TauD/TfdA family dioxygenase [Pigmentiphaga soli]|uniref:TauD/TfdA family dioxygenase n=1 Tax=Pigmentiphaga soli TaxID=1007095 RepID=A0ABP8HEC1_9BURK